MVILRLEERFCDGFAPVVKQGHSISYYFKYSKRSPASNSNNVSASYHVPSPSPLLIYNIIIDVEVEGGDPIHQFQPRPDLLRHRDTKGLQGLQAQQIHRTSHLPRVWIRHWHHLNDP